MDYFCDSLDSAKLRMDENGKPTAPITHGDSVRTTVVLVSAAMLLLGALRRQLFPMPNAEFTSLLRRYATQCGVDHVAEIIDVAVF